MNWTSRSKVVIGALAGIIATSGIAIVMTSSGTPLVSAAAADSGTPAKGIVTDGVGKVYGTPDTLNLTMGVSVTRSDVSTAYNTANSELAKVISALKSHGVASKDVQTSGLSINPTYGGGDHPVITGYTVSNTVTAVIHGLKNAGGTVDAAVDAGGNDVTVQGLSVSLDDDPALFKDARANAFKDAKDKAAQLAALSGRSLGKVISISESVQGSSQPVPFAYDKAMAPTAGASIPVEAGQQAVSVSLTVVWDFA